MNTKRNARLTPVAQRLRREMTRQERHLWYDFLKSLPVVVHRQKVIGSYVLDFYIASHKLAIELDGTQHFEDAGEQRDKQRDAVLRSEGITVLRYANNQVDDQFESVCQDIWNHIFNQ